MALDSCCDVGKWKLLQGRDDRGEHFLIAVYRGRKGGAMTKAAEDLAVPSFLNHTTAPITTEELLETPFRAKQHSNLFQIR